MALTLNPVYYITVSFKDRDGNISGVSVYYPSSNTLSNVTAEVAGTLIPALQGISDAVVVGFSTSLASLETDPLLTTAPETSDVERKAVFQFKADNGGKMKIEIPSVKNSLVVDNTNVLNSADPLVAAVITAFTSAGLDGLAPHSYLGSPIVETVGAPHKIHRKSSKG